MNLKIEKIETNYRYWNEINSLSKKSFPIEEYLDPIKLVDMAKEDDFKFLSLVDNDDFIGFMAIKIYKEFTYLFFLTIEESYRCKGYGAKAISLIKEMYPNKKHTVDFEKVNENASNYEQRIKRRKFYLRNGYKETGLYLSYLNVEYEVFCTDDNFNIDMFKEMMTTFNIEGFSPKYYYK